MAQRGPLCLGIDPHPELLQAWGLAVDADGLARFSDICVAAFGAAAVVKPQVAFFEAYGAAGFAVLERTIGALRDAGVLVLADAKRGDIGSTMAAYAQAWAGDSPLAADAVTASPYLGFGSLQPLLDTAAACSVHSTLAPGEGYTSLRPDREVPAARHRGVGPAPGGRACGVARSAYGAGRGPAGRRGGQAGRPRDVELHDLRGLRFATGKRA